MKGQKQSTKHLKSARGSKVVMGEGDRQRSVIV